MAKKAEPKFKITPTTSGKMIDGKYCTFQENRLDKVTFPKSFDGILTIPEGVDFIGKYVCEDKTEIKEVILPDKMRALGICAFKGCSNLSHIKLPSDLSSIGSGCFSGCTALEELNLPVAYVANGLDFIGISNETKITIDNSNPNCYTDGQAIYSKDGKKLIRLLVEVDSFSVKEGTTVLGQGAFAYIRNLKKITLPESIEEIQDQAFCGCRDLETINIPNSLNEFRFFNFDGCPNLKTIYLSSKQNENLKEHFSQDIQNLFVIK